MSTFLPLSTDTAPIVRRSTGDQLTIHSRIGDDSRPDVFELDDGRLARISLSILSSERRAFGVDIIRAREYRSTNPHWDVLGHCGQIYRSPAGSWELYPVERGLWRCARPGRPDGIHCKEAASARAAALLCIIASDDLTRGIWDYCRPDDSLKVGSWRVALLPIHAGDPYGKSMRRPAPGSVSLRHTYARHFLVTNGKGDTCRAVVTRENWGAGYCLHLVAVAEAGVNGARGKALELPAYVERFILSRCSL